MKTKRKVFIVIPLIFSLMLIGDPLFSQSKPDSLTHFTNQNELVSIQFLTARIDALYSMVLIQSRSIQNMNTMFQIIEEENRLINTKVDSLEIIVEKLNCKEMALNNKKWINNKRKTHNP